MEQRRKLGSGNSQRNDTVSQHLIAHGFKISKASAGLIAMLFKDILIVVNRTGIDSSGRNTIQCIIHIADITDHGLLAVLLE